MKPTKILVIGADGPFGTGLTLALQRKYGNKHVITMDDRQTLADLVIREAVTQVYVLTPELTVLVQVLQLAAKQRLNKVFWPSSIAVFGPNAPKHRCPQDAMTEPGTGEYWCRYYFEKHGVDARSLRFPGLVAGGGGTDYVVELVEQAIKQKPYTCFLRDDTCLPMLYLPDAIRATLQLMEAPAEKITIRTAYNVGAMSFAPCDLAAALRQHLPVQVSYEPDSRQFSVANCPVTVDDTPAREDWGWKPEYNLERMTADLLAQLCKLKGLPFPEKVFPDFPEDRYVFSKPYA